MDTTKEIMAAPTEIMTAATKRRIPNGTVAIEQLAHRADLRGSVCSCLFLAPNLNNSLTDYDLTLCELRISESDCVHPKAVRIPVTSETARRQTSLPP